MSNCPSLLPPNRTQLEVDLEKVWCRSSQVETPQRDIWNPESCPAELLPWLAWAESVDVWNDRWPESIKRAVIANARQLHEIKGTQGAVESALKALGVHVAVEEWWEQSPLGERGTMKLTMHLNDNLRPDADVMIDSQMIRDLITSIDRSKRLCVHYSFELSVDMRTGMAAAYSLDSVGAYTAMQAESVEIDIQAETGLAMANSVELATHIDLQAEQVATACFAQSFCAWASSIQLESMISLEVVL